MTSSTSCRVAPTLSAAWVCARASLERCSPSRPASAQSTRGLVGSDINPDVVRQVGRAYATMIRRNGGRRIAVGQDNRLSSNTLKLGFVEGARAGGVDVVDIGSVTTPILYFATAHWKLDGG